MMRALILLSGNSSRSVLLGGASMLALLGGISAARADTALETIVVVGQKENRALQKTPEAVTVLSAKTLTQNHINAPDDLNGLVPGLVVGEVEGYNQDVSIRGIGLNAPQDDSAPASVSFHQETKHKVERSGTQEAISEPAIHHVTKTE